MTSTMPSLSVRLNHEQNLSSAPPSVEKARPALSSEHSRAELTQATALTSDEEGTHFVSSSESDSECDETSVEEPVAETAPSSTSMAAPLGASDPLPSQPFGVSTSEPRRRRSSIKPFDVADIPIVNKSWKTLPKVDLKSLRSLGTADITTDSATMTAPQTTTATTTARPKHVVFDQIQMRNYSLTLGDNPSVSYGPPIQLDWEFDELEEIALDDYEQIRPPRRNLRQLMLNYYARRNILTYCCGSSEEEIKAATRRANRVKNQRQITNSLRSLFFVESAVESLQRKVRRRLSGGNKKR